ncbi:hypothetical protein HYU14_04730 [Candidatus Woesearchaeota archaeon]|nr:hypothetical protein [Candidatus Woesearchaeota archaeon]
MDDSFPIEGGTRAELEKILSLNRHYGHFVHPVALASEGVTAVVDEDRAIFYKDGDDGAVEYPPPIGRDAICMLLNHIKKTKPEESRVSRLELAGLQLLDGKADYVIDNEYKVITNRLDQFDPQLQGPQYKRLRSDVRRATREGLVFSTATKEDVDKIVELYHSWKMFMGMRGKELGEADWILERPIATGHYQIFKVERDRDILAAAGVGFFGETAFMDFRINNYNTCKASEFLDYMIFLDLRKRGVKFLERGVEFGTGLANYKAKFPPIETRVCYDISKVRPIQMKIPLRVLSSTAAGLLLVIGLFSNIKYQYGVGIEGKKTTIKLEMVLAGREKALEKKIQEIFLSRLQLAPEPTPLKLPFEDWEMLKDMKWAEYEKRKEALDEEWEDLRNVRSDIRHARNILDD